MALVRVRLAVSVSRLALGVAVAHHQAAFAQLAGGRYPAEVAHPHDCQHLDGPLLRRRGRAARLLMLSEA